MIKNQLRYNQKYNKKNNQKNNSCSIFIPIKYKIASIFKLKMNFLIIISSKKNVINF